MAFRAILFSAAALALTTGCYFETLDERSPGAPGEPPRGSPLRGEEGSCTYSLSTGCFDGYIASKQNFSVDGSAFFNADDLANRFHELVVVEGQNAAGEPMVYGEDYEIQLTTKVDNKNFYADFSYDLSGEVASGRSIRTGRFSIDKLPEGTYDLRIQRAIKFKILQKVVRQPDGDGEPTVEVVEHGRCATLYNDSTVDIRAGERARDNFNTFSIYMTDTECSADGRDTTINL